MPLDTNKYKDLYFKSHFQNILAALSQVNFSKLEAHDALQLRLYEVGALFEMHRVEKATEKLNQISSEINLDNESPAYVHSLARIKYLNKEYIDAGNLWNKILTSEEARPYWFRARLGMANIYFSQKRYSDMTDVIDRLESTVPKEGKQGDEWLSFLMLQGNYYWASGDDLEKAKQCFNDAISVSVMKGWYYFLARALFGLSCVAQASENQTALKAHLDTLQAVLKESDNLLLKHLTNTRFGAERVICASSFDIDYEEKRVKIDGSWRSFHKTPKLFEFFLTLFGSEGFVTKKNLAKTLWPREKYKPKIHDPRIFNIAGRVKKVIEAYESQPIHILSGRHGYKLATQEES